jgi:hypothetical protein
MNSDYAPGLADEGTAADQSRPKKTTGAKKVLIGIAAGIAVGVTIAIIAVAPQMSSGEIGPSDTASKADSSKEEPTEPSTKTELLPSEMDLEIPAGLSTEELAKTVIGRLDVWQNAGSNNQELYDEWRDDDATTLEFAKRKATGFASDFADAMFINGWRSKEDLRFFQEAEIALNADVLTLHLPTAGDDPADKVPYRFTLNYTNVDDLSADQGDGVRRIQISFKLETNTSLNRISETVGPISASTIEYPNGYMIVTLKEFGETEKISSMSWHFIQG